MRRFTTIACVAACLLGPFHQACRADPLEDVQKTLTKLNPISGAVSSLISQAAGQGNTILEQRLQELNGVLQLAIHQLSGENQKVPDIDEKATKQIAQLNKYVSDNLLPFDYLVHHNLADADAFMSQRVDAFYERFANTVCSTPNLKTDPVLQTSATGITTFKQPGKFTYIYLPGSCLTKYSDTPQAYLTGDNIVLTWSNLWKGDKLEKVAASNALIRIGLPDELLPNTFYASEFGLHVTLKTSSHLGVPIYTSQTIPLYICGKIPKITAHFTADAVGKKYVRKNVPYPKDAPGILVSNGVVLAHSSSPGGNGSDHKEFPVPTNVEAGWEVDMAAPDYGLVWSVKDKRGHGDSKRLDNHALQLSTDGSEGDAWLNAELLVKLIQVVPKSPCEDPVQWDQAIGYHSSGVSDIHDKVTQAIGKECEEARKELGPAVHIHAEVDDVTGRSYGSAFLTPNVPADFKQGSIKITMDNDYHITTEATPVCDTGELPTS